MLMPRPWARRRPSAHTRIAHSQVATEKVSAETSGLAEESRAAPSQVATEKVSAEESGVAKESGRSELENGIGLCVETSRRLACCSSVVVFPRTGRAILCCGPADPASLHGPCSCAENSRPGLSVPWVHPYALCGGSPPGALGQGRPHGLEQPGSALQPPPSRRARAWLRGFQKQRGDKRFLSRPTALSCVRRRRLGSSPVSLGTGWPESMQGRGSGSPPLQAALWNLRAAPLIWGMPCPCSCRTRGASERPPLVRPQLAVEGRIWAHAVGLGHTPLALGTRRWPWAHAAGLTSAPHRGPRWQTSPSPWRRCPQTHRPGLPPVRPSGPVRLVGTCASTTTAPPQ